MKKIPLNIKILIIFFIPAVALIYFSFSFVQTKYKNLQESSMYILSAKITDNLSKMIHNLQLERGLSAGYIVAKDNSKFKKELLNQYRATNKSYAEFLKFVNLESNEKKLIEQFIGHINKPLIKKAIRQFRNIENIRKKVLNTSISFDDEIDYYTKLNHNFIKSIQSFVMILKKQSNDNDALSKLQELKKNAGLERAYIYNQLLSIDVQNTKLEKIKTFQILQNSNQEQFFINASVNSTFIYSTTISRYQEEQLLLFRKNFFSNYLNDTYATQWFQLSSDRINLLEEISFKMLKQYINISNNVYQESLNSLYITALLWILSLISLSILSYILRNLIKTEEHLMDELRISAYTFDSHEAMTITNVNGDILKVNDAFSRITGYSASEVIGKNPRVLKSMKHSEEFYKEMWHQIHANGKWSNDIYNKRKNGEIYLERLSITAIKNEQNITTHYIAQFLDISDVKQAQVDAQYQADHDFLTGLINRKYLMQRLNEEFVKARRHNFLHAFLFIDLDEFKSINDTYGHKIGDKLLIEVSHKLKSLLRAEDIVSRISGDEFAIMILNIDKAEPEAAKDIKDICEKIIYELSRSFIIDEYKLNISASIGIKLFPDEEKDVQDVIVHADTAMYQAKKQGKNQFVFFDKAIELELKHFQLLEEELNHAYLNNEFKFHFQPKVDTTTNKIIGAEALIRWLHPQKGLLYPDAFLQVAIEINMIHNITILALRSSCMFIKSNYKIFEGTISININSKELLDPLFEQDIITTIKKYAVEPSRIELEITEDELIKDFDTVVLVIKRLKKYGIKFSIDDFGTGYSSMTYLQKLPVDSLKIDRSFIQNLTDKSNQELIKMMLNMAETFNMSSIVEGIENKNQLEFIKNNGAKQYQGFYFSKALNEENFISLLSLE